MYRGLLLSIILLLSGCNQVQNVKNDPVDQVNDERSVSQEEGDPFVTEWRVVSGDLNVTIPTDPAYTYAYSIDWGDGYSETGLTGQAKHTYEDAGVYQISIRGVFPHLMMSSTDVPNAVAWGEPENAAISEFSTHWDQRGDPSRELLPQAEFLQAHKPEGQLATLILS